MKSRSQPSQAVDLAQLIVTTFTGLILICAELTFDPRKESEQP